MSGLSLLQPWPSARPDDQLRGEALAGDDGVRRSVRVRSDCPICGSRGSKALVRKSARFDRWLEIGDAAAGLLLHPAKRSRLEFRKKGP
jgi:hypothetical protein